MGASLSVRDKEKRVDLEEKYNGWVKDYVGAWNSNDPEHIGALFTEDARYFTKPNEAPWEGRENIVAGWLDRKDEPDDTVFDYKILVATPKIGIVKGRTFYKSAGLTYYNLWEVCLGEDDRCREFVEWWIQDGPSD